MNHVLRLSLFCLPPSPPFWGLKMKLYYAFLSLFISSSLTLSSCFSGSASGMENFLYASGIWRWYPDIWGRGCWESIVWDHNIQGYALIQNREKNSFSRAVWEVTFEIFGGRLVSTAWKICNGKMFLLLKIKIVFFSSRKYFVPSRKAKSTALMLRGGTF